MRKRIKYKVGDILEKWDHTDAQEHFTRYCMVTGIEDVYYYGIGKDVKHYVILDLKQKHTDTWPVEEVDMVGWSWYERTCCEGWRKVR